MYFVPLFRFNPNNNPLPAQGRYVFAPDLREWCIESFGYVPDIGNQNHPQIMQIESKPPYAYLSFRDKTHLVIFTVYVAGKSFHIWPKSDCEWWLTFK